MFIVSEIEDEIKEPSVAHYAGSKDPRVWHDRLAHLNFRDVKIIMGISPATDGRLCNTCARCKITARPFPKDKAIRAKELLEIVHSDVMEVYANEANVERYAITFVDDYSRYGMTYYARTKGETMAKFLEYQKLSRINYQRQ